MTIVSNNRMIWLICALGIALCLIRTISSIPHLAELMLGSDNDDLMRLVVVRDWLGGQGWFDTQQYRVLPPEGISMHWSRYIDAPLGAILTASSWVLDPSQAELAAAAIWPTLLGCAMVLILSHGTFRLLGAAATIGALVVFLTWGKLGGEFVVTRIDHHNVQMICATSIFFLAVIPGRPLLYGALAGALTGLSLAIGLEMLPYLAVTWASMAIRHAFSFRGSENWLIGYGVALTVAAPLLMAGQTPVSGWLVNHCDVLAPPVMVLGAIGVVATLAPVLAASALKGPVSRIAVMMTIAAIGLWLAWPLLGPCLSGPYAKVAPEVRTIIETRVVEALPALTMLTKMPTLFLQVFLPPTLISIAAFGITLALWKRLSGPQRNALIQAFVVVIAGFAFSLAQARAINLATPAIPILGGILVYAFTLIPRSSHLRIPAVALLVLSMPAVVETAVAIATKADKPAAKAENNASAAAVPNCHTSTAMAEIASLPKALLFTPLNMGSPILAYTSHSVTSAPYHRSPGAFWNGVGAFQSRDTLQEALRATNADYVVLCAGLVREEALPYVDVLLEGDLPDWLTDVTEARREVRVLRVDKSSLAAVAGAP